MMLLRVIRNCMVGKARQRAVVVQNLAHLAHSEASPTFLFFFLTKKELCR